MYKLDNESEYICKNKELIKGLWAIDWANERDNHCGCTCASDTKEALKATFQFIKDHPYYYGSGSLANADITLGLFLLENQSAENNHFNYSVTYMNAIVKKVYDNFVILEGASSNKEKLQIVVMYSSILRVYHPSIPEHFEEYVNYINKEISPLCKSKDDESLDILVDLAKILGKNASNQGNFVFIYDGVLTREFKPEEISIVRNLIVLDEAFVIPITSISGFSTIGACIK